MNLFEAFKQLDALNEDTFAVSDDGIKKLAEFEQNDDLTDEISVMDLDAETEDDFSDSYVGKVILDCAVCHSKLYKGKDEIKLDDEQALANVGEECPYCYSNEGFKVIGEVAEYGEAEDKEDELKTDEEEPTDKKEDEVIEECISTSPANNEIVDKKTISPTEKLDEAVATLERPMSAMAGTLSSAMTAHQEELANVYDRNSAIAFLDTIEPEVKNKGYLNQIKSKVETLPHRRVLQFLYNIILKGDGMGTKMESLTEANDNSYKLEYYMNTAGRDRRPTTEEDVENDYVIDTFDATSDYEAAINAIYLTDDYYDDVDEIKDEFESLEDCIENFDNADWGDGSPFVLKLVKGSTVIYDSGYTKDDFMSELDECLKNKKAKSLKENVNNVNVETDEDIINVSTDDNGKVTVTTEPKKEEAKPSDEVIAPISDETKAEIEAGPIEDEETDVAFDDFDEEGFDELGEAYLKNIYENVESYRTTDVYADNTTLKLEGVIKFTSGNEKATQFIFEAKDCTKKGKLRLIGENAQITRGNKAFTLCGSVNNNKFITESFNYNYRAKDIEGKSSRVYGTLKKSK